MGLLNLETGFICFELKTAWDSQYSGNYAIKASQLLENGFNFHKDSTSTQSTRELHSTCSVLPDHPILHDATFLSLKSNPLSEEPCSSLFLEKMTELLRQRTEKYTTVRH